MRRVLKLTMASILLLSTNLVVSSHEHSRPDLDRWFGNLTNHNGALCCSGEEGTAVPDTDWTTEDGHYMVRLNEKWIRVPDEALVTQPNQFGRTVVWPYYINGEPIIRCFMPGPMI